MFHVMHVTGAMSAGSQNDLEGLLDELVQADLEHPDVAVQHESGVSLTVTGSWRLIVEDLEADDEPQWVETGDRDIVIEVMRAVSNGDHGVTSALDWRPGYGP